VDPISISIAFEGAAEATDDVDKVAGSLEELRKQQDEAAKKAVEFTDKFGQAAARVRQFADAIGNRTLSQLANFGQQLAENARAGAEFGRQFGPQGALVGGIVGAALPAFGQLNDALVEQQRRLDAARESAQRLTRSYDDLLAASTQSLEQLTRLDRLGAGRGTIAEQRAYTEQARQQYELARRALEGDQGALAELRGAGLTGVTRTQATFAERAAAAIGGGPALSIQDERERQRIREIADRARAETQRRIVLEGGADARAVGTASRGLQEAATGVIEEAQGRGDSRWAAEQAAWERYQAALDAGREQQEAAKALLEEQIALRQQATDEFIAQEELKREAALETIRSQAEAEQEAIEQRVRQQQEADDLLIEANRRSAEAHQQQVEQYHETSAVLVGGLTDALKAIAMGEATAEEAFTQMLAGFLKAISEQAQIKAIYEGAEAIAAFASGRYDQGALHLLAAGAYVGVAVAAGAGSAAVSASASGAARPSSEPERGRSGGGGGSGGGEIVVNFNAPVLSSDTRAQLGRQIQQLVTAGERYA
jgi:hypothetical protein